LAIALHLRPPSLSRIKAPDASLRQREKMPLQPDLAPRHMRRRHASRDRGPQHALRSLGAPSPQAASRLLVQSVRRQYQICGPADGGRGDRSYPLRPQRDSIFTRPPARRLSLVPGVLAAAESQVRTGLGAGGSWIRTFGSGREWSSSPINVDLPSLEHPEMTTNRSTLLLQSTHCWPISPFVSRHANEQVTPPRR
jgi:hypothetical protein